MKHTITVNDKNAIEHIIHLDQHLPITIKALHTTQHTNWKKHPSTRQPHRHYTTQQ